MPLRRKAKAKNKGELLSVAAQDFQFSLVMVEEECAGVLSIFATPANNSHRNHAFR
jgi:hypothetical protein